MGGPGDGLGLLVEGFRGNLVAPELVEEVQKLQILLVPEHASHQAEVDLCRTCGDSASRFAEVLSFRRLSDRVLSITGS